MSIPEILLRCHYPTLDFNIILQATFMNLVVMDSEQFAKSLCSPVDERYKICAFPAVDGNKVGWVHIMTPKLNVIMYFKTNDYGTRKSGTFDLYPKLKKQKIKYPNH